MIIPKTIETVPSYEGKIINIKVDKLSRDGEDTFFREVAVVSDSVAIVAIDKQSRVLLIQQYRHPMGCPVWEIPAGRIDVENETPKQTALRELREETDVVAKHIEQLTLFGNSVGWTTEKTYVFVAHELETVSEYKRHDEEADIEKKWIPMLEALDMVKSGVISDAKTIIGLTLAKERLVQSG